MAPPCSALNTWVPTMRSAPSAIRAAVSTGNAMSTSTLVSRVFQVKIGMRNIVIPGARMHRPVVMKLTAPRMVPRPDTTRPRIHRSPPRPGERTASDRGV